MPVEQMNISMSPKMAKFIRGKVKGGSYTNASEVVRTAIRRMQEEEAREARLARPAADDILAAVSGGDPAELRNVCARDSRQSGAASMWTTQAAKAWTCCVRK